MLQQSNSILRLCIVVVVVMLVQILPVLSQDVKIGTQTWTSKNLDVSTFRNGEVIPEAKSKDEWDKAISNEQPAWCYYDNDVQNGKIYGKLYNWYAVNDSRGLAPKGYHIPNNEEWKILTKFLGGEDTAGWKMKSKTGWKAWNSSGKKICSVCEGWTDLYRAGKKVCPDCEDWSLQYREKVPCNTCKDNRYVKISIKPCISCNNTKYVNVPVITVTGGDNSSGFNGLPGGFRHYYGHFEYLSEDGFWWSSSEALYNEWSRELNYYNSRISDYNMGKNHGWGFKNTGLSVRCIKD